MEKAIRYTLIILTLLFVIVFLIRPVTCGDVWFHLKTGEWITRNHWVPKQDTYSFTAEGRAWIDSHWLFQVVLYGFYRLFGINGLPLLRFLVFSAAFILLFRTGYSRRRFMVSLLLLFIVVFMTNERLLVRPEMFTFLFMALYMYILHAYKYKDKKLIWFLPISHIVWSNMHGLHVIGIVMVFSYLAGELICWKSKSLRFPFDWPAGRVIKGRKYVKLLMAGFAMVAVSFINPNGLKGALYPFLIFTEIGRGASEWMQLVAELKPSLYSSGDELAVGLYKLAVLMSLASILINIKRLNISNIIIFIGILYVSLLARRNMPLLGFIAMPLIVDNLKGDLPRITWEVRGKPVFSGFIRKNNHQDLIKKIIPVIKHVFRFVMGVIIVIGIAGIVTGSYYLKRRSLMWFGMGVSETGYPSKAVDFIKENNINGNIFNNGSIGGYFIWRCWPERKVFIDGRWEVFGDEFLIDYWRMINRSSSWKVLAEKYDIDYALFTHSSSESRRFVPELYESGDWALVYFDSIASVFVKRTGENTNMTREFRINFDDRAGIDKRIKMMSNGRGAWKFRRAYSCHNAAKNFLEPIGMDVLAEYEYEKALDIYPGFYEAYNSLGVLYKKKLRWDDSAGVFEEALRIKPDYAEGHSNYGNMLLSRGYYDLAIIKYKKAISLKRNYASAYFNLASLYNMIGKSKEAIRNYKIAIRKKPDYTEAYNNLGTVYSKMGMKEKAMAMFRKATEVNPRYFDARFNLAMCYSGSNWNKMASELEKAVEVKPDYKELNYNLGIAYEKTGQTEKAIKAYKREMEVNPDYASAYKNAGILCYGRGDHGNAAAYWREYLELNPEAPDSELIKKEINKLLKTKK